MGRVGSVIMIQ